MTQEIIMCMMNTMYTEKEKYTINTNSQGRQTKSSRVSLERAFDSGTKGIVIVMVSLTCNFGKLTYFDQFLYIIFNSYYFCYIIMYVLPKYQYIAIPAKSNAVNNKSLLLLSVRLTYPHMPQGPLFITIIPHASHSKTKISFLQVFVP